MKKLNKKGFTIVELVIVIAVIAILAGVMIPTFSGVVDNANKNAALQDARNAYVATYALLNDNDTTNDNGVKLKDIDKSTAVYYVAYSKDANMLIKIANGKATIESKGSNNANAEIKDGYLVDKQAS